MENIQLLNPSTARAAIFLAKAFSHPLRSKILNLLLAKPEGSSVTDIYTAPVMRQGKRQLEQSVCSQHLQWLRKYKLVTTTRNGKQIIYSINREMVAKTGSLISDLAKLAA